MERLTTLRAWALTALVGALSLSPAALADDWARIVLADGTVIQGEILYLEYGTFRIDTDLMDEISVDWEDVVEFTSRDPLFVELRDGVRYKGRVQADAETLTILETGEVIPRSSVAMIGEVDSGFWSHVVFAADLGLNLVRGNNRVTQFSFNANAGYETDSFESHAIGSVIFNEQTNAEDTQRWTLDLSHNQRLTQRWRGALIAQFEHDENKQLDLRSFYGGTFGYRVISTVRTRMDAVLGAGYLSEDYRDTPHQESAQGIVGLVFKSRPASGDEYDASVVAYPALNESGRVLYRGDFTARIEIVDDLDFTVNVFDNYDSKPPVDIDKNDFGLTVGLGWSY